MGKAMPRKKDHVKTRFLYDVSYIVIGSKEGDEISRRHFFGSSHHYKVQADNIDEALMKAIRDGCEGNYQSVMGIGISSPRPSEESTYVALNVAPRGVKISQYDLGRSQPLKIQTLDEFFAGVNPGMAKYKYYASESDGDKIDGINESLERLLDKPRRVMLD